MNVPTKLAAFSALLAAVFVAALGIGTAVGPVDLQSAPRGGEVDRPNVAPGGLGTSQDGYTLIPDDTMLPTGDDVGYRFTIKGPDGQPVTDFLEAHDEEMHVIVVRRDLTGFQHLHPTGYANGVWGADIDLRVPGTYRVMADFTPAATGERLILGTDLLVPGDQRPTALPAPNRTAEVDGYTVTLSGQLVGGWESTLTFSVAKAGRPVTDLTPHLGAYGYLVALRSGDAALLQVRPKADSRDGTIAPGPSIYFAVDVPSPGSYRLYLEFLHEGKVHTAEFTATALVVPIESTTTTSPADVHDHGAGR